MSRYDDGYIQFNDVQVVKITPYACLLEINDNEFWIPFSNINQEESDIIVEGNIGTVFIKEWLVKKEHIGE